MGIGWVQLLIVLGIVILIFGTKKLRNVGGDLGGAIKNFKKAVKDEGDKKDSIKDSSKESSSGGRVIEGEASKKEDSNGTS